MGMPAPFSFIARGEGDFEFARGHYGVLEEELVNISEAEHQQGVGDLLLDTVVLPHKRRRCVTHGRKLLPSTLGWPIANRPQAASLPHSRLHLHSARRRFPGA